MQQGCDASTRGNRSIKLAASLWEQMRVGEVTAATPGITLQGLQGLSATCLFAANTGSDPKLALQR